MAISDTDKLVAATLAAAKATAMGCLSAEDYIAEYQSFLYHFEMQGQIAEQQNLQFTPKPLDAADLS
jgi:hypothetical protein